MKDFSNMLIPIILVIIVIYGMFNGGKVYEWFLDGAKEGLMVCMRIFPALLAMIVAVRIFKESNLLYYMNSLLEPVVGFIGLPTDLVPLVLIKPLSGSGALGIFTDILNTVGPDSRTGLIASVLMGTTETIFYTVTIYFGAIGIKKIRHTLWSAVFADIVAVIMAITAVSIFFF